MSDEVTWVCWSTRQQMNNAARDARVHIQGENGRTLCGIKCNEDWDFDVNDYPPSEFRNCYRCHKAVKKLAA